MGFKETGKFHKMKLCFRNVRVHMVLGMKETFKDNQVGVNLGFAQFQVHAKRIVEKEIPAPE